MTTLPWHLLSCLALLLLGLLAWRLRAAVRANREQTIACERRERALHESARALLEASRHSSDAVIAALERNLRALDGAVDTILVFAPSADELVCIHASGARAEHFQRLLLRRDDTARLPVKAANAGCRAIFPRDGNSLLPTDRVALAAPMLDAHGVRAVVYVSAVNARALRASDAIVRAVDCAAAPYAVALEREADRAEATYDGLTGVMTPRAFRACLHDEIARAALSTGAVVSLWFVDTDRFKSVNDQFGHRAGDAVLVAMAGLLQAHAVAETGLAARNGGDEFCALIRGASKSLAIERAQAFCDAVRAYDFGVPVRITASVGVATFPYDAASSNELLEAADAAMYYSKRAGRDRVAFVVARGHYAVFEPAVP